MFESLSTLSIKSNLIKIIPSDSKVNISDANVNDSLEGTPEGLQ